MEKLNLDYLMVNTARQYDFYLTPKMLIDHDAFTDIDYGAKILYSLLLNRASLSATNPQEFTDEQGRVYIIYTVEQVMKDMRCSNKTAIKMLQQLDEIGLIEKKRLGQGKPSIIYVKNFSTVHFKKCKKYTSKNEDFTHQEVNNLHTNKNDLSNNDFSKNQSINQSEYPEEVQFRENKNQTENDRIDKIDENLFDTYLQILKTNVQYDTLCLDLPYSKKTIDEMLLIVADTLCSKKPYLRISGEDKPADHVKGQLLKLSSDHIRYVDGCMDRTTTEIHNIRAYLLSTLYNSTFSIDSYYKSKIKNDFHNGKPK